MGRSGNRGLLPAAEQQGLDAQPVGINPKPMIEPTATGSQERDVAELLARGSTNVHLDDRHRHRRHRIAQRHRRMGISAGIEHHTVVGAVGLLYGVDQLAFEVGLEITEPDGRIECFELPEKRFRKSGCRRPRYRAAPAN